MSNIIDAVRHNPVVRNPYYIIHPLMGGVLTEQEIKDRHGEVIDAIAEGVDNDPRFADDGKFELLYNIDDGKHIITVIDRTDGKERYRGESSNQLNAWRQLYEHYEIPVPLLDDRQPKIQEEDLYTTAKRNLEAMGKRISLRKVTGREEYKLVVRDIATRNIEVNTVYNDRSDAVNELVNHAREIGRNDPDVIAGMEDLKHYITQDLDAREYKQDMIRQQSEQNQMFRDAQTIAHRQDMKLLTMSSAINAPAVSSNYQMIPYTTINPLNPVLNRDNKRLLTYEPVHKPKLLTHDPRYDKYKDPRSINYYANKLAECKYDKRRFKKKFKNCKKDNSKINERLADKSTQLRACKKYVKKEDAKNKRNMKQLINMYNNNEKDFVEQIEDLYEEIEKNKSKKGQREYKTLMLANKQSKLIDKILDRQAKALPKRLTRKAPVKRKVVKRKAPVKRKPVKRVVFSDASEGEEGVVPYRNPKLKSSKWSAPLKISF